MAQQIQPKEPFHTSLDKLIEALEWIRQDERGFELPHFVTVKTDRIDIVSDGFIYEKIKWYLQRYNK